MDEADATQDRLDAEMRLRQLQRLSEDSRRAAAPTVRVCQACDTDLPLFRIANRYSNCVECQTELEKDRRQHRR